jgi:hypothetical protein
VWLSIQKANEMRRQIWGEYDLTILYLQWIETYGAFWNCVKKGGGVERKVCMGWVWFKNIACILGSTTLNNFVQLMLANKKENFF